MLFELQICDYKGSHLYVAIFERYVDRGVEGESRSHEMHVTTAFDTFAELGSAIDLLRFSLKSNDFSQVRKLMAEKMYEFDLEAGWTAWNCGRVLVFHRSRTDAIHFSVESDFTVDEIQMAYEWKMDLHYNRGAYGPDDTE